MGRRLIILFWCLAADSSARAKVKDTVHVISDDYCPYVCTDESRPGISVELLGEIFKRRSIEVKFHPVSWARALKIADADKADIIAAISKYELKEIGWAPTEPMGPKFTASFFVYKKKNWKYRSVDDLKGLKVGLVQGYVYPEPLGAYLKRPENSPHAVQLSGVDAIARLTKMLVSGRIDVLPLSKPVMYDLIRNHPDRQHFSEAGDLVLPPDSDICAGVRPGLHFKGIKDPVQFINQSLADLKNDGTYQRILKAYGQATD